MEIDVKQRLRDAIKSQGESISSVSKLIGAKQNTLSRQINTDAPIPLSNILLIIDALGLSPSWLLAGEGDMLKSRCSDRHSRLIRHSAIPYRGRSRFWK